MKKIIALMVVAAFALSVTPALAHGFPMPSSDITVNTVNSGTVVGNNVVTVAKTGGNFTGGGLIATGAASAYSFAENSVNGTQVTVSDTCDGCNGDVSVNTFNNGTFVGNDVVTVAKSGGNDVISMPMPIRPCFFGNNKGGVVLTGDAYAYSSAANYVNQTIVRVVR